MSGKRNPTSAKIMALDSFIGFMMAAESTVVVPDWKVVAAELVKNGAKTPCYSYGKKWPSLDTWRRALQEKEDLPRCWILMARYVASLSALLFTGDRFEKDLANAVSVECAPLVKALLSKRSQYVLHWTHSATKMLFQHAANVDFNIYPDAREFVTSESDTAFWALHERAQGTPYFITTKNSLVLRIQLGYLDIVHTSDVNKCLAMFNEAVATGQTAILDTLWTNAKTKPHIVTHIAALMYFSFGGRIITANGAGLVWYIRNLCSVSFLQALHLDMPYIAKTPEMWREIAVAIAYSASRNPVFTKELVFHICISRDAAWRWPVLVEALKIWSVQDVIAFLQRHPTWGNHLYMTAFASNDDTCIQIIRTAIIAAKSPVDKALFTGDPSDFAGIVTLIYGDSPPSSFLAKTLHPDAHCYFTALFLDALPDHAVQAFVGNVDYGQVLSIAAVKYFARRGIAISDAVASNTWMHVWTKTKEHAMLSGDLAITNPCDFDFPACNLIHAYRDAGLSITSKALLEMLTLQADCARYSEITYVRDACLLFCQLAIDANTFVPYGSKYANFMHAISTFMCTNISSDNYLQCFFKVLGWRLDDPFDILAAPALKHRERMTVYILRFLREYHPWPGKRARTTPADWDSAT